jgi:hypothetical protein
MAQGNLDVTDVRDSLQDVRNGVNLQDALSNDGNTSTESGIPITGTITTRSQVDLAIQSPVQLSFTAGPDAQVSVSGSTVTSAENTSMTAGRFDGDIHISASNTSITGTIQEFSTDQLAFDYDRPTEFTAQLSTPRLTVNGLERQSLQFANTSGTVSADGTDIEGTSEQAVFDRFSGNLTVAGTTYSLTGTVRSAVIGTARIE